jgi:hypothetical protein
VLYREDGTEVPSPTPFSAVLASGDYVYVASISFGGLRKYNPDMTRDTNFAGIPTGLASLALDSSGRFYTVEPRSQGYVIKRYLPNGAEDLSLVENFIPRETPQVAVGFETLLLNVSSSPAFIASSEGLPLPVSIRSPLHYLEGDRTNVIPVVRTSAELPSTNYSYSVTSSNAFAGRDFSLVSGTVHFEEGQRESSIQLSLHDNAVPDLDRTLLLQFTTEGTSRVASVVPLNLYDDEHGLLHVTRTSATSARLFISARQASSVKLFWSTNLLDWTESSFSFFRHGWNDVNNLPMSLQLFFKSETR